MHSATIKYCKTLELIHFQIKIPKGGQAKAKKGRMLPPPPLKETLIYHIVEKFQGRKFSRLTALKTFRELNFED